LHRTDGMIRHFRVTHVSTYTIGRVMLTFAVEGQKAKPTLGWGSTPFLLSVYQVDRYGRMQNSKEVLVPVRESDSLSGHASLRIHTY